MQTSREEREDRPRLWRSVFDNDIRCKLGRLRHDLLRETSHTQEVGKKNVDIRVECGSKCSRQFVVKRACVRRHNGS